MIKDKPELVEYLLSKRNDTFDIKNNNCVQFTNKCWELYHGFPWCEDFNTVYSLEEVGIVDPLAKADELLEPSSRPVVGDLVVLKASEDTYLKGYLCGFCIGDLCAFLGSKGIKYLPTKKIKLSWSPKNDI